MSEKIFKFKIGDFDGVLMKDGYRKVPTQTFSVGVSEAEHERIMGEFDIQPDGFPLTVNLLTVNTGEQQILIDTGVGRDIGIDSGKLIERLAEVGLEPGDIDLVIITHGHADHVGGITDVEGNMVFPDARYIMSKPEWEHWTDDEVRANMDAGMRSLVEPALEAIKDRVELVEGDYQVAEGVRLIPAKGHTVGHMAVLFESNGEQLLHIADAAHHHLQVTYPQVTPTFDALPDISPTTRAQLFQKAADEGMKVVTYHFDFPSLGCVVKDGDGFTWEWFKA